MENLFIIIWFGFFLAIYAFSVLRFGYQVWFKTDEFIRSTTDTKNRSPKWFGWITKSTSVPADLMFARILSVMGILALVPVLIVVVLILVNTPKP